MADAALTPAFVLHTRPFKETSLLVELLTEHQGRLTLVAKGVRGQRKSSARALLQPFQPLNINWSGRSELKTLKQLEPAGARYALTGMASLSALYLNELLLRLLLQWDPQPEIYQLYQASLKHLAEEERPSLILREFELQLLEILGYAIDWQHDAHGDLIEAELNYACQPEQGFMPQAVAAADSGLIKGELILAVANHQWQVKGAPAVARKVCRMIIDQLLGGKVLNSRKLLQQTLSLQS